MTTVFFGILYTVLQCFDGVLFFDLFLKRRLSGQRFWWTAAAMALKKGIMEADPVLLEPIAALKVTVSDAQIGDVMGELSKRRARINGMTPDGNGDQLIAAEIPIATLYGFGTVLRSLTGGNGSYSYEFLKYEEAPGH